MNPRLQAGVELQLEKQANEEKELKLDPVIPGEKTYPTLPPLPGGFELSPSWAYGHDQKADIRRINEEEIASRKKKLLQEINNTEIASRKKKATGGSKKESMKKKQPAGHAVLVRKSKV